MTSDSGQRARAHNATAAALYVLPEAWQDLTAVSGLVATDFRISCWTLHGSWPRIRRAKTMGSRLASRTTDRSAGRPMSLISSIIARGPRTRRSRRPPFAPDHGRRSQRLAHRVRLGQDCQRRPKPQWDAARLARFLAGQ